MARHQSSIMLMAFLLIQWQVISAISADFWKRSRTTVCITLDDVTLANGHAWYGHFNEQIKINLKETLRDWKLTLTFDKPVTSIEQWNFEELSHSSDGKTFVLGPHKAGWNMELQNQKDWSYIIKYPGPGSNHPSIASLQLKGTVFNNPSVYATCSDATTSKASTGDPPCQMRDEHQWPGGQVAEVAIPVTTSMNGWTLELRFDSITSMKEIQQWKCKGLSHDATTIRCSNENWNKNFHKSPFQFRYLMTLKSSSAKQPRLLQVKLSGPGFAGYSCDATIKPTTMPPTTPTTGTTVSTKATTKATSAASTTKSTTSQSTKSVAMTTTASTQKTTESHSTTTATATVSTTQKSTLAVSTTPVSCTSKYDYVEVLEKSLLFYEAQRSGRLPASNRIPWRKDSALSDGDDVGLDLTGGYYDAGDGLKLGFPMAFTVTMLAWGMVDYSKGYRLAKQEMYGREAIKWATDYFIKCHPSDNVFYGQVGDKGADHGQPGRIEDFTGNRPSKKIDDAHPGSELAAETAAALAASSMVFKTNQPRYATALIEHAETLYSFAKKKRGKYSTHGFCCYPSFDEGDDELAWAAAWLYRATKKTTYLQDAENIYSSKGLNQRPSEFSWSSKIAGVQALLLQITGKLQYKNDVSSFTSWLRNGAYKTPKGLVWLQPWGSNRHAANVALICLVAADHGISTNANRKFAQKQINYMLGDGGRSYVVGFGHNPPKRPHHRNSACKGGCKTWDEFKAPTDNAHILYGALVGGPGRNDEYTDVRTDYQKNEVAVDYNAGFQSAIAALISLDCDK